MGETFDIGIVGSGPAGLSAAGRLLLEVFDHTSKTIYRYQKNVMSEPGCLGVRSDLTFAKGKREEVLGAWDGAFRDQEVNVRLSSEVVRIEGQKGVFRLTLRDGAPIAAAHVVLANGVHCNPRKLGGLRERRPTCITLRQEGSARTVKRRA